MNSSSKLPIEKGVDVISVGTSFLRFLEIAEKLNKPVAVVTDNDGNVDALKKKYESYLGEKGRGHIRICFDDVVDARKEIDGESFNFNTLEPRMLAANGRGTMNEILGTAFDEEVKLLKHMRANKTDCALKIFNFMPVMEFPAYVTAAIEE